MRFTQIRRPRRRVCFFRRVFPVGVLPGSLLRHQWFEAGVSGAPAHH